MYPGDNLLVQLEVAILALKPFFGGSRNQGVGITKASYHAIRNNVGAPVAPNHNCRSGNLNFPRCQTSGQTQPMHMTVRPGQLSNSAFDSPPLVKVLVRPFSLRPVRFPYISLRSPSLNANFYLIHSDINPVLEHCQIKLEPISSNLFNFQTDQSDLPKPCVSHISQHAGITLTSLFHFLPCPPEWPGRLHPLRRWRCRQLS